jgi:hypothetical protein
MRKDPKIIGALLSLSIFQSNTGDAQLARRMHLPPAGFRFEGLNFAV